jgi:hypothetical protein
MTINATQQATYRDQIARTTALAGHTSPETAYVIDDYPYGFRLRCSIRYWLECKKGHGFRLISQTSNPKKPGLVWNKPKAGTYHAFAVMVLDPDTGHVHIHTASSGGWTEEATIQAIETHYAPALTDEHKRALRYIRATNKANEVITVTVSANDGSPRQTLEEQQAIYRKALAYGYQQTRDTA